MMDSLTNMDDLGVSPFQETSMQIYIHAYRHTYMRKNTSVNRLTCVNIPISFQIRRHTDTYTDTHTDTRARTSASLSTHTCTYVYIYIYIYIYVYIHIHLNTRAHTHILHMYIYTHIHTHKHIYTCILYIYIHTHSNPRTYHIWENSHPSTSYIRARLPCFWPRTGVLLHHHREYLWNKGLHHQACIWMGYEPIRHATIGCKMLLTFIGWKIMFFYNFGAGTSSFTDFAFFFIPIYWWLIDRWNGCLANRLSSHIVNWSRAAISSGYD